MNEEQRQRLSALCDGELEARERLDAIDELGREGELRETFGRYQLISDVLRNNYRQAEDQQLAARVRAALADEPTVLSPRRAPSAPRWRQLGAGLAVAASVAAVAVVGIQVINEEPELVQLQADAPQEYIRLQAPPTSVAVSPRAQPPLEAYVVNHNEASQAARLVSQEQGK